MAEVEKWSSVEAGAEDHEVDATVRDLLKRRKGCGEFRYQLVHMCPRVLRCAQGQTEEREPLLDICHRRMRKFVANLPVRFWRGREV
jgi:hypothetical protein